MTPLVGQKVTLRRFIEDDITATYIGWLNDRETMRFSNQRFSLHDRQTSQHYLNSFTQSDNSFYTVREKTSGRMIGTMTAYLSRAHGTADMGILIGDRAAWGQGFGHDAWITLMEFLLAQTGIRKVTAGTLACNAPMLRVAAKSGMVPDGQRKLQEVVDGRPSDVLYFAKFDGA